MDSTALWAFIQQKAHGLVYVVVAVAIFIAGWQMGRVMSPYYASHPIVFQDVACPRPAGANAGSTAALADLQEQGRVLRAEDESPVAQVAGIQEKAESPSPEVGEAPASKQEFVASVNSTLYHHKSCATVERIKEENKRWFASSEAAEEAGFKPSKCALEALNK